MRQLPAPVLISLVVAAIAAISATDTKPSEAAAPSAPLAARLKAEPFKIAWDAYANGNSDIWVMNADGSGKVNLTQTPGENEHYPQVSPDGTKIAYTIDVGEGRDAVRSLWLMDIDGKNRRKIADHAREPFWAPDGKVIAYLPQEYSKFDVIDFYTKGMVYYHLDSGTAENHPNSAKPRHLYHPRFAPNGKWVISTVHGGMGFGHAILAIEAHGNRIVDLKIPGCRPTVSVDGQFIAWNSDDHELTTAPLDAEAETPHVGPVKLHILDKKNDIYLIAWSPDGRYVAFGRGPESDGDITKPGTFQWGSAGIGVYAPNWNLFAVPADRACTIDLDKADKADVLQLTHDGNSNKEPFWFRAATRPAAAEAKE